MLASKRKKLSNKGIHHITLCAHPFIITYLKAGFPSIRTKWYFKYKLRLHLDLIMHINFFSIHFLTLQIIQSRLIVYKNK